MRDAILQAAFFLQEHPEKFNFSSILVPSSTNQRACALGWIGYFSGEQWKHRPVSEVADHLLGINDWAFYFRLDRIVKWFGLWTFSGRACSRALRKYADKYFPDPTGMKEYMYV